jgi:hypothetical protein
VRLGLVGTARATQNAPWTAGVVTRLSLGSGFQSIAKGAGGLQGSSSSGSLPYASQSKLRKTSNETIPMSTIPHPRGVSGPFFSRVHIRRSCEQFLFKELSWSSGRVVEASPEATYPFIAGLNVHVFHNHSLADQMRPPVVHNFQSNKRPKRWKNSSQLVRRTFDRYFPGVIVLPTGQRIPKLDKSVLGPP